MKVRKKHFIITFMYVCYLLVYFYVLSKYGMGDSRSNIRHYVLFAITGISFLIVILKVKIKDMYSKELILLVAVGFIFIVQSYYKVKGMGLPLNMRTYVQTFFIIGPAVYAFSMLNILDLKGIINLMKWTLIITVIGYFSESEHTIMQFFDLDNWLAINPLKSTGNFMESSMCSEIFAQLFFFFYYFRNLSFPDKEKRSLNKYMIISFIFTVLSFKRLAIVCCICLFFAAKFIDFNKKTSNMRYIITALAFCIVTHFYTMFIKGEIFSNVDVSLFTTGRDYIFYLWKMKDFVSYGFGTSLLVIGRYLEMDLIQISIEMGFLSLFLFSISYFKIASKNNYSYIVMLYAFLNMLTASSLPMHVAWIVLLLTVSTISSGKIKDEEIEYSDFTLRFKRG